MSKQAQKWIRTVYVFWIFVFVGWVGFSLVTLKDGAGGSVSAVVPTPELHVEHKVSGEKLFLSFRLKHFDLQKSPINAKAVYGAGHIQLLIDGVKVANIYKSAYVYPTLSPGQHSVVVQLAHHDGSTYGITKPFTIDVPNFRDGKRIGE